MTSKIEKELQKATGIKPKPNQERDKYLDNLSAQADKMNEDKFAKLSAEARAWCNAASDAVNAEKPVPDFEDDSSAEDETEAKADESKPEPKKGSKTKASKTIEAEDSEDDDAGETEEEDEDVASKKKAKGAAKSAKKTKEPKAAKPAKVAKAPKERKARGNGKLNQMKALILDHPEDSAEQLTERLAKKGVTLSKVTVSTVRSDFRSTVAFLVEKGLIKTNPFVTK